MSPNPYKSGFFFDNLVYKINQNQMMHSRKFILAITIACLSILKANAQGSFGAPLLKVSPLNGETGLLFGGMGAAHYGNFYFGGAGMGLVNGERFSLDTENGTLNDLSMGYGGLLFGYQKYLNKPLSLYTQGLIAWGSYSWKNEDDGANFFLLEPEAGLNIHASQRFTLALGLGYRFAIHTSKSQYELDQLNGFNATLAFKFGNLQNTDND